IAVIAFLHPLWQSSHPFDVASSEDNDICDKGKLELRDNVTNLGTPGLLAKTLQTILAHKIFDLSVIAIGQIAELELKDVFVPYQRRSESGAKTEKEQATLNMAAEGLHCGVIDHTRRLAQKARKIESCPAVAKMFRILHDFAVANRRWKSNGDGGEL